MQSRAFLFLACILIVTLSASCQSGRYREGAVQQARIVEVKMNPAMSWPAPRSLARELLVPLAAGAAGGMASPGMASYSAGVAAGTMGATGNTVDNPELYEWFKSELLRHLKAEIEARRQFQIVTDASAQADIVVDVRHWGFGSNINIKMKEEIGCGSWAIIIMKSPQGKVLWSTITKPMTWNFDARLIKRSRQEYAANPGLVKQDLSTIARTVAREAASSLPLGP